MFNEKNRVMRDTMNGIQLTEGMPFYSLHRDREKLFGKTVVVRGFLITKGEVYGSSVLLVIEPLDGVELLYLPERYVEEFKAFTDEEIKAIHEGHLALTDFHEGTNKYGQRYTSFKYLDR